jgi:hypothetical protein
VIVDSGPLADGRADDKLGDAIQPSNEDYGLHRRCVARIDDKVSGLTSSYLEQAAILSNC